MCVYINSYDEEVNATVNGMRHFGISKGVISRAIVRFSSPPEPHPLTVCFHFPGAFLTHKYVLEMLRSKLNSLSNARVAIIQFVDRNTIHGTQGTVHTLCTSALDNVADNQTR